MFASKFKLKRLWEIIILQSIRCWASIFFLQLSINQHLGKYRLLLKMSLFSAPLDATDPFNQLTPVPVQFGLCKKITRSWSRVLGQCFRHDFFYYWKRICQLCKIGSLLVAKVRIKVITNFHGFRSLVIKRITVKYKPERTFTTNL